jgi:hypothetical protein
MTVTDIPTYVQAAEAIGIPVERWNNNCHVVSLAIVRSGLLSEPGPSCRVVRGFTSGYGIGGQHSWIALGRPFDPETRMLDYTAHTWGEILPGVINTTIGLAYRGAHAYGRGHLVHGYTPGSIWEYGKPEHPGKPVPLDTSGMSEEARIFLDVLGPLSVEGWVALMTFPHGEWPAHEICEAVCEQIPRVRVLLPIDVLAHVTDRNPNDLYW